MPEYKPYYERINTIGMAEERSGLIRYKIEIPAPKTKEEYKKLEAIYLELLDWYKEQIENIETSILPRLKNEMNGT